MAWGVLCSLLARLRGTFTTTARQEQTNGDYLHPLL